MSTELTAGQQPATSLTLATEQTYWTEGQVAALRHMGVQDATPGDLAVFFHVVKRTGLDPFARQIYMIGRWSKEGTKYTIQTGIDGYRLIGRRAADARHETISISAPEWAHEDGSWRPVWSPKWGTPVAARVVVRRNGQEFPGVALFDEYKQVKRDGGLTQMWAQRPAGQIAKCAEALAWRMAFPQDLANVYVEDELHQASNPDQPTTLAPARVTAADFTAPAPAPQPPTETTTDAEVPKPTAAMTKKMFAALREVGAGDRASSLAYVSDVVGRAVASSKDLSRDEVSAVIDALENRAASLPADEPEDTTSYDNDEPLWPDVQAPGGAA